MSLDDFFRGLLAALRLQGIEFVETRGDSHHARFRRVVETLRTRSTQFPRLPRTFVASPFTGRYRELDEALVQLQCGFLGAQNPFYPGVHLDISEPRARHILDNYEEPEKEVFAKLAQVYAAEDAGDAERLP
jgi:hypothetical protein